MHTIERGEGQGVDNGLHKGGVDIGVGVDDRGLSGLSTVSSLRQHPLLQTIPATSNQNMN